jgi:hypothetical protein
LCYIIVSDEFALVELSEYPLSERLLYYLKVYRREPGEYAIFPVPVSEKPV